MASPLSSVYNFSKTMAFFLLNFHRVNICFFLIRKHPAGASLIFVSGILSLLSDVL